MRRMTSTMAVGLGLLTSAAVPSMAMNIYGAAMAKSVYRGQPPRIGAQAPRGPVIDAHLSLRKTPVAVPQSRKQCVMLNYRKILLYTDHDAELAWAEANLIC